ncbi:MAG: hypothetical protein ABIP58_05585 [Dehalococcoidia bacterium]
MTDRFELRLTEAYQQKLGELGAAYDTSTSEAVRRAIDEAYDALVQRRRMEALERILAFEGGEEMPEPEELKRQIEEAYSSQIEESLSRIERDYEPNGSD